MPPADARNQLKSKIRTPASGNGRATAGSSSGSGRPECAAERGELPDCRSVLAETGSATADHPGRAVGEPLPRDVDVRTAAFGIGDLGEGPPRAPVRIVDVLLRASQRRDEQAGFLRLLPRRVLERELGEQALQRFVAPHRQVRLLGAAWDVPPLRLARLGRRDGNVPLEVGAQRLVHAVCLEETRGDRGQLLACDRLDQDPPPVFRVGDRRHRRDDGGSVPAGLPVERDRPHHPAHQVELGALGHRLVHCTGEVLSLAGRASLHERGRDHHRQLLARDVKGLPHLRCDRRKVVLSVRLRVVAAVHHRPAERQMHEIRALPFTPGPRVAERGHPRRDQCRMVSPQRLEPLEAVFRQEAEWRRVEDDVGLPRQLAKGEAVVRGREVERHRSLRTVVVPEEKRPLEVGPVAVEWADRAGQELPPRRLDLDHLGPEPGKKQARVLGLFVGKLDDADAVEHRRIAERRCRTGGVAVSSVVRRHPRPRHESPSRMPTHQSTYRREPAPATQPT